MVPHLIEICLESIKHWNVMLGKMLFIELKTSMLKKKLKQQAIVFRILDQVEKHDSCGIMFFFILWSRISHLYHDDLDICLKLVNKLTSDHINLTPYSVMSVRLAAQVLSETLGNVLNQFVPLEAAGTAEFCLMRDTFFDRLNVRNTTEHELKRKPNIRQYVSPDDIRFKWLDTFL